MAYQYGRPRYQAGGPPGGGDPGMRGTGRDYGSSYGPGRDPGWSPGAGGTQHIPTHVPIQPTHRPDPTPDRFPDRGIRAINPYINVPKQGFLPGIRNKFRDFTIKMRGWNEEEDRLNTQAEYEANRQNRINQKRIQNITSRDIPWREQTLQTLGNLGYQGDLSRSQIGTTPFDRYPPRVGTIVEDAAEGIRATDAAQDMIYPKRKPIRERTRTFPEGTPTPYLGAGDDLRKYSSEMYPSRITRGRLFTDREGVFSPKMQTKDQDNYYRAIQGLIDPDFMGSYDRTGPLSKPEDREYPYINYQELNPNPYSYEGRAYSQEELQDPFYSEYEEYNPLLQKALINQKNRSGELVPTESRSYDTTDVTSLDEGSNKKYAFESGSPKDKRLRTLHNQVTEGLFMNDADKKEYQDLLKEDAEQTDYPKTALVAQGGYMRSRYKTGGRVGILAAF